MKIGDLVRHRDSGDYGIVVEDQEDDDGLYKVAWSNGDDGYFDNKEIKVVSNEAR